MKTQRKEKIIQLIGENRMVKAGQLAEIFQVSSETIRRDLEELEAQKPTLRSLRIRVAKLKIMNKRS